MADTLLTSIYRLSFNGLWLVVIRYHKYSEMQKISYIGRF